MTNLLGQSAFSEEFEQLKAKFVKVCTQQSVKTIMVTSCHTGDGVSTIATNLAAMLSAGFFKKVLLIDFNPKKPPYAIKPSIERGEIDESYLNEHIHKFLKMEDNALLDAYSPISEKFSLIALKPDFEYSSNFFQAEAVNNLFKIFKSQYDYIIFDAPPVFASSGRCCALGAVADGVLLVLRAEHTKQEVAKNARHQLESAGANVLGVIVNMRKYYIPDAIYRWL